MNQTGRIKYWGHGDDHGIVTRFQIKRRQCKRLSICEKHDYMPHFINEKSRWFYRFFPFKLRQDEMIPTTPTKKKKKKKSDQPYFFVLCTRTGLIQHFSLIGRVLCCSATYINRMWCLIEFRNLLLMKWSNYH